MNQYREIFPEQISHLIEPFCGSSAVFFSVRPKTAILGDSNFRIIETYNAIKNNVNEFMVHFSGFAKSHSVKNYYHLRAVSFETESERAAQFVYLNRVCFNGIYRENLNGKFNVPIGTKTKMILETDNFIEVSNALQSTEIVHADFEATIDLAETGNFLYVDPPYVTRHNFNGFAKYNQRIFSWDDQERLALALKRANARGVSIISTNADHPDVRALYEREFRIFSVSRTSVIASKAKFRGRTTETVLTNVF